MQNLNVTTTLALCSWPLVAPLLYKMLPIGRATLWTILGGYLLLPVDAVIKFEMIPPFDKNSIPSLVALVAWIVARRPIRIGNGFGLVELLIVALLIIPFISSSLNSDQIAIGPGISLPGVGLYDAGSAVISQFIVLIPFFLGRSVLRGATDTENILRTLVIAGLLYSLPILFEIRMSPQLHIWIYGYFPHWFLEQIRDGGFRPVVFLGHGLLVAFFVMTTVVAAAALWRTQTRILRLPPTGVAVYLGVVLVLCKTLGSLVYGAVLVPLVRWTSPRMQIYFATVLVAIALTYPILRMIDIVPTTLMVEAAESLSNRDRADSLKTRFINERILLDRASERFWFGWGRFGRSFIYNSSGTETSLTDGFWIIIMGEFGFIGFLATFGLLGLSVFRAASALRLTESTRDRIFYAALALITAVNIVDLLPNSSIRPWTWLLAGALLGRAETLRAVARQRVSFRKVSDELAASHRGVVADS